MQQQSAIEAAVRTAQANWLFQRLPPWIVDTLNTEQKEALHHAVTDPSWARHAINIRVSVPFLQRRYYVTIVGGEERRSQERRAHERHRYPLRTVANAFFVVGIAAAFYALAIVALALQSTIIEW